MKNVVITPDKALQSARSYCAFQERCHSEMKDKLYSWNLHKKDVDEIIAQLISEGFLNEERFAIAYAGGKFRIKKWGKEKIRQALKSKFVSDYSINKALNLLEEKDVKETIKEIIAKKSPKIKEPDGWKKKHKIAQYLLSRGFEKDMIWGILGEE
jgi:regulatory protein